MRARFNLGLTNTNNLFSTLFCDIHTTPSDRPDRPVLDQMQKCCLKQNSSHKYLYKFSSQKLPFVIGCQNVQVTFVFCITPLLVYIRCYSHRFNSGSYDSCVPHIVRRSIYSAPPSLSIHRMSCILFTTFIVL